MTDSPDPPSTSSPTSGSVARAWIIILSAGFAAALITWAAGEALMVDETGSGSRGGRIPISPVVYSTRNGMASYGILGASLGMALGLAGGLLRGSARSSSLAGLVGLVLGGVAGAATARGLVPFYFSHNSADSLSVPLLVHGGIWSSIAIAAGLAFGLGVGGPRRAIETLVYAVMGALFATFTYEFGAIVLFPAAQTDRPLPMTPVSRIFAHLAVGLVIAVALAFGFSRGKSPKQTPAPIVS